MKKRLLIGTALLAAVSAFPQNRLIKPSGLPQKYEKHIFNNAGVNENAGISPMHGAGQLPNGNLNYMGRQSGSPSTYSWKLLTGSMNTYGMLVSTSRPLQYNPNVNAVSFIHRKSTTYSVSPAVPSTAESGVIVAMISTDWGTTWDSTALWANATDWGRYPQGGIYSPPGNTSISNAYVVGSGPTVAGTAFSGNWYASKRLNTFDNVASTTPGAQQFLAFGLPSYPANQAQHGWSRNGFSVTDDGLVRSIGITEDDYQGLATVRCFAVATGSFNGTTFDWTVDTVCPTTSVDNSGAKNLNPDPQMAWNKAGTVGYIVGVGDLAGSYKSNIGMQPIIYKIDKTTNANATWSLMPSINFNNPMYRPIVKANFNSGLAQLDTIMTPNGIDTVGAPFVESYDIAVDADNKLHIGAVFMSQFSNVPDSLNFLVTFTTSVNPTERYKWRHNAGSRPYIYDFIGDGSAPWQYVLVDSIASEGPSPGVGSPGYGENPWDPTGTGGAKINMDSRLQLGRTPDGEFITFSWTESDSGFTNNAFKWNTMPDIKTRCMAISHGTFSYVMDELLGPGSEAFQNITENDNNVKSRATLHYMSPTTGSAVVLPGSLGARTVEINTPFTVTNSSPYSQLTNNATWYGATKMAYAFKATSSGVGIEENSGALASSYLFPNPASNNVNLHTVLKKTAPLEINVMNTVGQVVKTVSTTGYAGENRIRIDLSGLASGVYIINMKAGDANVAKKVIVE